MNGFERRPGHTVTEQYREFCERQDRFVAEFLIQCFLSSTVGIVLVLILNGWLW